MSKEKPAGPDTAQALQTLDQLSQTIEVMSEVVERLKRHLSRQLRLREQELEVDSQEACSQKPVSASERKSRIASSESARDRGPEGVELEISTYRRRMSRRASRIIH